MCRAGQIASVGSIVLLIASLYGCSGAQKNTPHFGFGNVSLETKLDRDDIVVMESVQGSASSTSVLLGLFQVIDGDKYKLLYIPFFTEKYSYFRPQGFLGWIAQVLGQVSSEDRAYYKALEQAPDADVVLYKSRDQEKWGIPLLFKTDQVTWRGKALKLKADM